MSVLTKPNRGADNQLTVDPIDIPTNMTRSQLEAWILFGVLVANKEAVVTRNKLEAILQEMGGPGSPFRRVRRAIDGNLLDHILRLHRVGQYRRIGQAFREVINLDLDKLSVASLEAIHGIGPKTARMIVLYAIPGVEVVPLDTHILKYLKAQGHPDVPKSTPPSGPKYARLESIFIEEAKKSGMSLREFDTHVWKMYATSTKDKQGLGQ